MLPDRLFDNMGGILKLSIEKNLEKVSISTKKLLNLLGLNLFMKNNY